MLVPSPGWWFQSTPLKNMTEVSWDDEIPNIMGKKHVPNHQPG